MSEMSDLSDLSMDAEARWTGAAGNSAFFCAILLLTATYNINPLSSSSFKCLMLGDGGGSGCDLHHPLTLSCGHF